MATSTQPAVSSAVAVRPTSTTVAVRRSPTLEVRPSCESCGPVPATFRVVFRDDTFDVCGGCLPQGLVALLEPIVSEVP